MKAQWKPEYMGPCPVGNRLVRDVDILDVMIFHEDGLGAEPRIVRDPDGEDHVAWAHELTFYD